MRMVLAALSLALTFAVVPGGGAFGQSSSPAANPLNILKTPMVFYLAKGEPDACGPGCGEWIAAEGTFDPGVVTRLRAFLARPRNARLPIYFHSPGGLADRAFTIGRMFRERGVTAGVSKTEPEGCKKLDEKACNALKRSGQTLTAELNSLGACNSACVYALIGAKVRHVPPGARLGVHSSKLITLYADGRITAVQPAAANSQTPKREAQTRKYIGEMGIDARLLDIASKVPHESAYYLNRDEIASLRIDERQFQETRWMVVQSKSVSVRKFFLEAKGPERREYRVGIVDFSCAGPRRAGLIYIRGLSSDEVGTKQTVALMVDGKALSMTGSSSVTNLDVIDFGGRFDRWGRLDALELLEAVAKQDKFEIAAGAHGRPLATASATKLSTAGLSSAIDALRQKCGAAGDPYFPTLKPWGLTE